MIYHLFILSLDPPCPWEGEVCLPLWPLLWFLKKLAAAVEGAHVVDALAASPLPSAQTGEGIEYKEEVPNEVPDQPDGGKGDTAEDSKSNSETDEKRQVRLDGLGGFPGPGVVLGGDVAGRLLQGGVVHQMARAAH